MKIRKICFILFYILTIAIIIKFRFISVNGQSMCPTLHDGQICIAMNTNKIKDGDIVVIDTRDLDIPADYIIKRFYEDKSDSNTIYVQGDNLNHSLDSRTFGNLSRDRIVCKVIFSF